MSYVIRCWVIYFGCAGSTVSLLSWIKGAMVNKISGILKLHFNAVKLSLQMTHSKRHLEYGNLSSSVFLPRHLPIFETFHLWWGAVRGDILWVRWMKLVKNPSDMGFRSMVCWVRCPLRGLLHFGCLPDSFSHRAAKSNFTKVVPTDLNLSFGKSSVFGFSKIIFWLLILGKLKFIFSQKTCPSSSL